MLIQLRATHFRVLAVFMILLCGWIYTNDFRQPTRPLNVTPPPRSTYVPQAALHPPPPAPPAHVARPPQATPVETRRNTIVMAAIKSDNTDWVAKELSDWDAAIYSVDNDTSRELHTPANKGKESMAYLTYIIDNYDNLPNISIFLHAHRDGWPAAWHTDNGHYSNPWAVQNLKISTVETHGFVNLRCNWVPGCPAEIQPFRKTPEPDESDIHKNLEGIFARVWKEIFGAEAVVPDKIGTPCCAQFAVTREAVKKRTKVEWEGYRDWLLKTDEEDDISGRVFEFIWHILFGREVVMCKEYKACYCEVYGKRC